MIILTDNGEFKAVGRTGNPGDMEITGGQSFILIAQRAARVGISGDGWYNSLGMAAAPSVGNADLHSLLTGIQVTDTTPVLALRGSIVDEGVGVNKAGFPRNRQEPFDRQRNYLCYRGTMRRVIESPSLT